MVYVGGIDHLHVLPLYMAVTNLGVDCLCMNMPLDLCMHNKCTRERDITSVPASLAD